jgi:hypothetical protein
MARERSIIDNPRKDFLTTSSWMVQDLPATESKNIDNGFFLDVLHVTNKSSTSTKMLDFNQ